ncbi:MAG: transcriptional repressor NrdR [Herpetosiphonaceae bacterium]|nr:transcriptional repressor NrdR [Herpetosiphonaceae bacterium]
MRCPYCQANDTQVIDTRKLDGGVQIRRRRRCEVCEQRFSTLERLEVLPLMIVKKNGVRELFDRDKLEHGIKLACYRRPVSMETVQQLLNDIETTLVEQEVREVPSAQIGDMVMDRLRGLDEVAYIRFASVYRSFADLGKLREAVESLMDGPSGSVL